MIRDPERSVSVSLDFRCQYPQEDFVKEGVPRAMKECAIQPISVLSTDSKYSLATHSGLPRSYSGVMHQAILRYLTLLAIAWHFEHLS